MSSIRYMDIDGVTYELVPPAELGTMRARILTLEADLATERAARQRAEGERDDARRSLQITELNAGYLRALERVAEAAKEGEAFDPQRTINRGRS